MITLKAQNLSRGDVHRLLGLQPLFNGSFDPLLPLEPLTNDEQRELLQIQHEFRDYWVNGKLSEGQVRFLAIAPLLRLAGFNRAPMRLQIEEDIARIYIEDEDTFITGRLDILAIHKNRSDVPSFWTLIVESKNSDASELAGVAQLLTYAFTSLQDQASVWGLVTNGVNYQFCYLQQGNPPTYQLMPVLNWLENDRAIQLLQILKAICQL